MAARWAHNPKVVGSNPTPATKLSMWHTVFFSLGGKSAMDPPVPIPNTEVKLRSADDTASARVWENRSLPGDYFVKNPRKRGFFYFVVRPLDSCLNNSDFVICSFNCSRELLK